MNGKNFIKKSVFVGMTGLAIYGSINLYRLYKSANSFDVNSDTNEYQNKYINKFIRKYSQTSK